MLKKLLISFLKLFLLWILIFDFQRILFSIHNWDKFGAVSMGEWFGAFFYSLRLDVATASGLNFLPLLFLTLHLFWPKLWIKKLFYGILIFEFVLVAMIHCGEINAYGEWNHKLTSRVFMHLSNPDEVFRSADYSMTFWFFVYLILELAFSWKLMRRLFAKTLPVHLVNKGFIIPAYLVSIIFLGFISMLLLRGGFQQIPININAAIYSNNSVSNDLSMNPLYFFTKSYMLYNRSEIDEFMPDIDPKKASALVAEMHNFPKKHERLFLTNKRPNIVIVVLESWAAEAIGCMSETKGATPNFDRLSKEGVLFTNIYGTSHTSEIGNASIFSGFPSVPEVSISMQPEKSRKLKAVNQSLKPFGYNSSYLFSGDLKYGNIGGYFLDHGFDKVQDEDDFEGSIPRGKLNYYDKDLYNKFLKEIGQSKQPFLQCAFTGSTHSPFDVPKVKGQKWKGNESGFMNSLVYADKCLGEFIRKAQKESWYKNTLFIFVADHSHTTPDVATPMLHAFYRIPLLFWGPVIDPSYKGIKQEVLGSQFDIPATLLYQMGIGTDDYPWSKDLMNPLVKQFAFHNIIRGYGWVSPKGYLTYQMQMKQYLEESFDKKDRAVERMNCHAYMTRLYQYYKDL